MLKVGPMKSKIISLFIFLLISFVGLYYFRISVIEWSLQKYIKSKGIEAQFTISSFGFKTIKLIDVSLDNKIFMEELSLELKDQSIESIELKASRLDINEVKILGEKFNPQDQKNNELNFQSINNICDTLHPLEIKIDVKNIVSDEKVYPIEITFNHLKNSTLSKMKMSSQPFNLLNRGNYEFENLKINLNLNLDCLDGEVNLTSKDSMVFIKNFQEKISKNQTSKEKSKSVKYQIKDFELKIPSISLSLSKNEDLKLQSQLDLKAKVYNQSSLLTSFSFPLSLNHQSKINQLLNFTNSLSIKNFKINKPFTTSTPKILIELENKDPNKLTLQGRYKVDHLNYSSENSETMMNGLNLKGDFLKTENSITSHLQVTDDFNLLHLNKIILNYDLNKSLFGFELTKENTLKLNNKLSQLLPSFKSWNLDGDGTIHLLGQLNYIKEKWQGHLKVFTDKLNIKSSFFNLSQVAFKNEIKQYPDLLTHGDQSLSLKHIVYGTNQLDNLKVSYRLKIKDQVEVNNLSFNYEKASLEAKNFNFDIIDKRLHHFRMLIHQYDLEKLLKLPMGDAVTAHGILDGELFVEYPNNIPLFSGSLTAQKNGWIRYRKSTIDAKSMKSFSANPMDILNRYLYDFYYENLDVVFKSDAQYDMKMTLRTLGRNPEYLSGKPLKLNINLDQNLLAAFKAMMLTYDLPKRIEDKIEKLGEK
jgi:hypothetical protein